MNRAAPVFGVAQIIVLVGLATGACNSRGSRPGDASTAGDVPATGDVSTTDDVSAGDGTPVTDGPIPTETGGAPDAPMIDDGGNSTPPTAADLQGAWYALPVATDGGFDRTNTRLRFDGNRYYWVQSKSYYYCVEVGTFTVSGSTLTYTIDYVQGFGPCVEGTQRAETIRRTDTGMTLVRDGVALDYVRARNVPKVFVTIETHDGNIAGDALLPGASAIEKADNLCNRSVAKPDGQHYRALLVDGANRTAIPPRDWVLRPLTTYFRADGSINVFTTNAAGTANPTGHHALIDAQSSPAAWTGLGFDLAGQQTCLGWTTNATGVNGGVSYTYSPQFQFAFGAGQGCSFRDVAFLCVSDVAPDGGSPDGGAPPDGGTQTQTDAGPANATEVMLQGTWTGTPQGSSPGPGIIVAYGTATGPPRLRVTGKAYALVWAGLGSYCGEIGAVDATATSLHFRPQRIEGYGNCLFDVERTEAASFDDAGFTLSRGSASIRYVRAPDVARIFATLDTHSGDFANDASLPGTGAIAKADAFCNQSTARPDGRTYKAILVDGTTRSASPGIDWALKPSTPYFQAIAATELFRTNTAGLYDQSIASTPILPGIDGYFWTGLNGDGTVSSLSCMGWSSHAGADTGRLANAGGGSYLTSGVSASCWSLSYGLFCAAQ